jgi:hypothetical protein
MRHVACVIEIKISLREGHVMRVIVVSFVSVVFALCLAAHQVNAFVIVANDFAADKKVLGFDEWNGTYGAVFGVGIYHYPGVDIVQTSSENYVSVSPPIPEAISPAM